MINNFIQSFKLKITYNTNTIIYSLKQIFLINKLLPQTLYGNKGLKTFANVVAVLFEIISVFVRKFTYIAVMLFLPLSYLNANYVDSFLHIFIFLTIAGAVANTQIFNPTKDKYYAMFLLRMNAKSYTLNNYFYFLFKILIGIIPFSILFCLILDINLFIALLMPLLMVCSKNIFVHIQLLNFMRKGNVYSENLPNKIIWTIIIVANLIAYGLPYFGFAINQTIFVCVAIITIIISLFSLNYILKYK